MAWVYNLHTPDPNSKIPRAIAICLSFSIVSFLAVCLRFYVRLRIKRMVWVDDFAALAGALLTVAYAGIAIAQTRWGQGLSEEYFPEENVIPFSKVQYAGGPVYTLDILCFKVALLTSYLRIGGFIKAYKVTIYAVIAACTVNQLLFTFLLSFACKPVAKQWDDSIDGTCIKTVQSYYALAGTSIAFDLVIITLPMPVLWTLKLQRKQKIVLGFIFTLGFFVTIIQAIRISTIASLQTYTDSQNLVLWSLIEVSLGIIISCIPTYGPLFRAFATTLSNRYGNTSYALDSNYHSNGPNTHLRTKNSTHALASCDRHNTTTIHSREMEPFSGVQDAVSEEHILGENYKIHTKTEFTVERH